MSRSSPNGAGRVSRPVAAGALSPSGPPGRTRLIVILGPTGAGKSEVALALAERIGGHIVGCDALQVYVGFDAATAKPSPAARRKVPHHLVDLADPRRDYSLADYVRDADAAIASTAAAGAVPIVVGGTGLYLRGLLKGLVAAPPRNEALRLRLRGMTARFGSARLHRWLRRLDPGTASRVAPGDTQRIVRAIELALTGDPWSRRLAEAGTWQRPEERYDAMKFGLDVERSVLAERLAARVDRFFAAGLVTEVRGLLAAGVPATANAFKAIGYREVAGAIARGEDPEGVREGVARATRQYAKRQRTWFRREPGVLWLDAALGTEVLAELMTAAWLEAIRGVSAP